MKKAILLLILGSSIGNAAHIQSIAVQTIPSSIYFWSWKLVSFQIVDAELGRYVVEESHNLQQWRICAEVQIEHPATTILMLQEEIGGVCRFYRIAKLGGRINK